MPHRFLAATLLGLASPVLAQRMPMDMPHMGPAAHPHKASKASKTSLAKKSDRKGRRRQTRKKDHADHPGTHGPSSPMASPLPNQQGSMSMPEPQSGVSAMTPMDRAQMGPGAMSVQTPSGQPGSAGGHQPMAGMPMGGSAHGHTPMPMTGALGPYPMQRESSGTAWQPDNSEPMGLMTMSGNWTLMGDGRLNLVFDHQSGPRGADKAFASGMLMAMARRPLGKGTFQLRAMFSPDPLMGKRGYPLLLASGETANGRDRLIDRQHPHDFFMELSASATQNLARSSSLFLYAGLPAEPAFGPPAFMHREAIFDSPEAPISHHWLDSTHISFGVVTAGLVLDRVKLEVSRFNGREPDQHRWNIETGPLDSTAVRFSWNPTAALALQASWGHFTNPEQLEPGVNQNRLSASILYAREVAPGWKFAGTLAWGRKSVEHHDDDAAVVEASLKHDAWTIFARGETTRNRELAPGSGHESAYEVGKVSIGAVRDFEIAPHFRIGTGGLVAVNFVPNSLAALYDGNNPAGLMGFVRLKLN